MANIFSHPAYVPTDGYVTTGYNLVRSAGNANSPNYFGPWTTVSSGYVSNLAVVDSGGSSYWDLYRVQPIIQLGAATPIPLEFSRPFFRWTPLYDTQINYMLDGFRRNWIKDPGVRSTDSTVITESTGQGAAPFITDPNTPRFYLGFIANDDPEKFIPDSVIIYAGATESAATALIPYTDYYPNPDAGYVDFKVNPAAGTYLKAEYTHVQYTNEELRNILSSSVSELSSYQINNYQVKQSFNYSYLTTPLPTADLGEIVQAIAMRKLLGSEILSAFQNAEAWKDGKIEYTADPSRSIQAGTLWHGPQGLGIQIKEMCNNYIVNTRSYASRGEFDSFFDQSGIIPVYNSYYNVFNYYSWWL